MRGPASAAVVHTDVETAIKSLQVLGGKDSIRIVDLGECKYISQIELSTDFTILLDHTARNGGRANVASVTNDLGWAAARAQLILESMIKNGVCWIDEQVSPPDYYVMSQALVPQGGAVTSAS